MKIQKVLSRLRNDFRAIYECEHCAATEEDYGYEDTNFHAHVIPAKCCKACGNNREGKLDLALALKESLTEAP